MVHRGAGDETDRPIALPGRYRSAGNGGRGNQVAHAGAAGRHTVRRIRDRFDALIAVQPRIRNREVSDYNPQSTRPGGDAALAGVLGASTAGLGYCFTWHLLQLPAVAKAAPPWTWHPAQALLLASAVL